MKKFCEFLKEHAIEMTNFKTKKMKLLTNEQQKSYENTIFCYVCKETFKDKHAKVKEYCKVRDHRYYTGK